MRDAQVDQVRRFNRLVTQAVGALHDHYLGRNRPLAESRVLFEIGRDGTTASKLRARLNLDSGYLSRLLQSLERQDLLVSRPHAPDKRVRELRLTKTGRAELREIDRRSNDLAAMLLSPLGESQRARLVNAMADVERLLSASLVSVEPESPSSSDAKFCLSQYFGELAQRFESRFDPARSLDPTLDDFAPPAGIFIVMRLRGEPVGCGGFKHIAADAAYLKRMWIAPDARGLGLGKRLLGELEQRARAAGYRWARLETNRALSEAQQLYRRAGYREVEPFNDEPYAHHWFEKSLIE